MKVMIRNTDDGLSAYVAKKDLEAHITDKENENLWGGWILLSNGWKFQLPEMEEAPRLPITVEARKIS